MKKKSTIISKPKSTGPKVPAYKDKNQMPSSVHERASRYFELRDENDGLKTKLKDYESDIKKFFSI